MICHTFHIYSLVYWTNIFFFSKDPVINSAFPTLLYFTTCLVEMPNNKGTLLHLSVVFIHQTMFHLTDWKPLFWKLIPKCLAPNFWQTFVMIHFFVLYV